MTRPLVYDATLLERIELEPTLAIFRVLPDDGVPPFIPGQYVTLGLNDPEGSRSVRRPMSIASAPEETSWLEFYVRYVERPESDLPLTHLLWPAPPGGRLFCRPRPAGRFTLPDTVGEDPGRLKVLVAAGTGLAPFVSMLRSRVLRDPGGTLSEFVLLYGARSRSSLGYHDEMLEHARARGLRYLPSISRPHLSPDWDGPTGRIESHLAPPRIEATERRLGLEAGALAPARAGVLICGLQGTIANTLRHLASRGFTPADRRLRRARLLEALKSESRKTDTRWRRQLAAAGGRRIKALWVRNAVGLGADAPPASLFWEQYDAEPIVNPEDSELIEALRTDLRVGAGLG